LILAESQLETLAARRSQSLLSLLDAVEKAGEQGEDALAQYALERALAQAPELLAADRVRLIVALAQFGQASNLSWRQGALARSCASLDSGWPITTNAEAIDPCLGAFLGSLHSPQTSEWPVQAQLQSLLALSSTLMLQETDEAGWKLLERIYLLLDHWQASCSSPDCDEATLRQELLSSLLEHLLQVESGAGQSEEAKTLSERVRRSLEPQ
jgi:hypothetical protein